MGKREVPTEMIKAVEGVGWILEKSFFEMATDEYPGYFIVRGLRDKRGDPVGPIVTLARPLMSREYGRRGQCIGWAYLDFNHHEIKVVDGAQWQVGDAIA